MAAITDTVKPGDIITADLFNRIIALLNAHDAQLAAGTGPGAGLAINQLVPSGPYRVGDTLQIFGQNFEFTLGATRVFLNATQVINLLASSTNTRLEFSIPNVPGLVEAGTSVDLVVLNRTDSVTRQILLRPRSVPLQGNVLLNWLGVTPAGVPAGQDVNFRYRIESRTNLRATWQILPVISVASNAAAWNDALRVLDAFGNNIPSRQIVDLDPGSAREFIVALQPVPAGTGNTPFGLSVTTTAGGLTGESGTQPFVVGAVGPQPDPGFTASLNADFSAGSLVDSTLTVPSAGTRQVAIDLTLTAAGDYTQSRTLSNGATGWTVSNFVGTSDNFTVQATELAASGSTSRRLRYTAAATTTASTPGTQVQFVIQRAGQTTRNSLNLDLVRA
jgi:hypothetical protein